MSSSRLNHSAAPPRPSSPSKDALAAYDLIIWLGDLNYRVDLEAGCAYIAAMYLTLGNVSDACISEACRERTCARLRVLRCSCSLDTIVIIKGCCCAELLLQPWREETLQLC